jgi:hypothetical protein
MVDSSSNQCCYHQGGALEVIATIHISSIGGAKGNDGRRKGGMMGLVSRAGVEA